MMKYLKLLSLILVSTVLFSTHVFAANDLSANDLVNEFTKDETAIDPSVIENDVTLPADESDTLDGVIGMIRSEPSNTDYYDKAVEFYSKNNDSDIKVFSEGNLIDFSKYNNVLPVIDNGHTMVPARALAESMGAAVDWNPVKNLITIVLGDKTVLLTLNSNTANVNGANVAMDAPAKSISGRTMIPLRFVSQNFGKQVGWYTSGYAKLISIYD